MAVPILRLPNLAAFALVVCSIYTFASSPASSSGNAKPTLDLDLTTELCDLHSQQPFNDPPAGVDFLSENEVLVYTVCHTSGTLAERGDLRKSDPNHLTAVVIDITTGTITRRFDWPTRGRGSMLRVTHGGQLLLKLDNVLQLLKPDRTAIAGLTIPKVSPGDLVWASMSPAVDAVSVTLSSNAPDGKTVNGVAILDTRNLRPMASWHEDGEWWNLSASAKSVVRTAEDSTRVESQGLENIAAAAPHWTAAWSGSKVLSPPVFVNDSGFAFPARDSVFLIQEGEPKPAQVRCTHLADTSSSPFAPYFLSRAGRIAVSRDGQSLGTVCVQTSTETTKTGWIARAEVYSTHPFRVIDSIPLESAAPQASDLALSPMGLEVAFVDSLRLQVFRVAPPGTWTEDIATRDRAVETARPARTADAMQAAEGAATFRTTARLVTVEVVAIDRKGSFIRGLRAEDFTVREDGKVQNLASFNTHIREEGAARSTGTPAPLAPNEYTNIARREPGQAVTMILFDVLNTETLDQIRARKEMVKFLQQLPPGQNVALFVLGSRIHLVQGFSGDSNTLTTAANLIMSEGLQQFAPASESDLQNAQVRADTEKYRGDQTAQRIADLLASEATAIRGMHTCTTADAVTSLARAASGYPGRKNLFWLSGDFPLPLRPEDLKNPSPCQMKIVEVVNQMSAAEIAVYPVSVRGLEVGGIALSTPTGPQGTLEQATSRVTQRQGFARFALQQTVEDLAHETGGHAFYGTNDLKDAMAQALQHGENYYTLTYVPSKADWNGKYRKIDVKLARPGATLNYRRGYYAVAQNELSSKQAAELLAEAMVPAVPESTMLPLRIRVRPPDQQRKTVSIEYTMDAAVLGFSRDAGSVHRANIDLMAIAWDGTYKGVGHLSNTLQVALDPESYQKVLQNGVTAREEIELKPGTYTLRIGAIDRASQKIGTVDVHLVVAEH